MALQSSECRPEVCCMEVYCLLIKWWLTGRTSRLWAVSCPVWTFWWPESGQQTRSAQSGPHTPYILQLFLRASALLRSRGLLARVFSAGHVTFQRYYPVLFCLLQMERNDQFGVTTIPIYDSVLRLLLSLMLF